MNQSNLYQILCAKGYAPEDMLGKRIITVYHSINRNLGIGLFQKMLAVQDDNEDYMVHRVLRLSYEMLSETPASLLYSISLLHKTAEERGIDLHSETEGE